MPVNASSAPNTDEILVSEKLDSEGLEILQWRGKYLFVPVKQGVAVVHIRRAQVRILFERYMGRFRAGVVKPVVSQKLLIPEDVTLTRPEVMALADARESLLEMGMDLSKVDDQTIQLRAVPTDMTSCVREALDIVLETYHDGLWTDLEARQVRWAKAWAQRAAVKGHASMPLEARRHLVSDLWACDHPNVDPDGKTILSIWAAEDLENPFC